MSLDPRLRDAWLRAEAQCECTKEAHGHGPRCLQVLIWEDRGETGKGGWEVRPLNDPRRPACEILCAACYTRATGKVPMGSG